MWLHHYSLEMYQKLQSPHAKVRVLPTPYLALGCLPSCHRVSSSWGSRQPPSAPSQMPGEGRRAERPQEGLLLWLWGQSLQPRLGGMLGSLSHQQLLVLSWCRAARAEPLL